MRAIRLGASVWEPVAKELRRDGRILPLTALEARLLGYLADRAGRTVGSEELLREVWEYAPTVQSRAVANSVARLRNKLADDASSIVTVYGRGYRLEPRGDADLVGRDALVERVRRLLHASRWVTLYGLGGVGKTRVARAVAEQEARRTLWVPCGAMSAEGSVWAALAAMLEMPGSASPGVIRRALDAAGPACVVLDAVESLGESAARLASSIVADCPEVRLVVTARVHHGDGVAVRVEPLDPQSAVELFLRRVAAVQPDQVAYDEPTVRVVVAQVESLPLGIELAAARLRLFDLNSLAQQMRVDPHIVNRGEGSLQTVLEQSWRLLSAVEQRVLAAAAQFPESFTIEQVRSVAGVALPQLLDALEALVRASLVLDRHPRFRMLDLVRVFGAGKADDTIRAQFERDCVSAAQSMWKRWLVADPMRRDTPGYPVPAFGRLVERVSEPRTRAWLVLGLFVHSAMHGSLSENRELLVALSVDTLDDELTACVRLVQAWNAYVVGAWDEAQLRAREGQFAAERAGATGLRLRCGRLAVAAPLAMGTLDEGLLTDVSALVAEAGDTTADPLARAGALHVCGIHRACTGQLGEAADLYRMALALAEGDLRLTIGITGHLGYAYRQLGRLDLAVEVLQAAWQQAEEAGLGSARLGVGVHLAETMAAAGSTAQVDALQSSIAAFALRWGERAPLIGALLWKARREPDPLRREASLEQVAARAVRDDCPEDAGACELWRGHSLHARGELDAALHAYDAAVAHMAPYGQLFVGTLAHTWRACLQVETGAATSVEVPLLDAPSPLESTLISLVRAAANGDWSEVEATSRSASDDAVRQTIVLIERLRSV